jgi:phosphoribosyl 1,2-cyclic phosphodiesterase
VLLTHYHLDHLIGLPSFQPLYDRRCRFTFYGVGWEDRGVQNTLDRFLGPPWFPISFGETGSVKRFVDLDRQRIEIEGLRITSARLNHPQGVTAFRLESAGRSVVFATDHEVGDPAADERLRALAEGCDILIHDAQYTPDEYDRRHRGWGHSTWSHAVEAARNAGAGRLILFHHDPERTDDEIDSIVEVAARSFPDVAGAREGMSLRL